MTGSIEIVARVNGEVVSIPTSDLVCIRVSGKERIVRVLPGVVARCFTLGAEAIAAEQTTRSLEEIARDCGLPKTSVEETLFEQGGAV